MSEDNKEHVLLPHHEQQELCDTRLSYRQGRKLTAVKVYSINNESRHLLVFGVPSLNLRQETKALFSKFGQLQLNITKYPSEQFTETYHALYQDIQSARLAKKMLDTKSFYGGHLHICYAPELESIEDTRKKLCLRKNSVVARLKNLQKSTKIETTEETVENKIETSIDCNVKKKPENTLFMGDVNVIGNNKRKVTDYRSVRHSKLKKIRNINRKISAAATKNEIAEKSQNNPENAVRKNDVPNSVCEVVDFTSVENEILTNINDTLNYDSFGKELIRKVPCKPVNKIKFNLINKS